MTGTDDTSAENQLIGTLEQAMHLLRNGQVESATSIYHQILEQTPDQPDALHYLGLALHGVGDFEQAIAHIKKALSVAPYYVEALNNLGVIYQSMGELKGAENCYRKVIEIQPEHSDSYSNLGVILKRQGRIQDARDAFEQALVFDPGHSRAHHNLGNLYQNLGQLEEAALHFRAAIDAGLSTGNARQALIHTLHTSGKHEDANAVLERWLQEDPDHPIALHLKMAFHDELAPSRASDGYVKMVFDEMAATFDDHLGKLDYRAPELAIAALNAGLTSEAEALSVLDAGCGTGLCGPLVKPMAARLVGVDLSSKMLQKAQMTGVYDELYEAELTAFLQSQPGAYDIIICADTLCYFGELSEVSGAAASALKPGGSYVFTVENLATDNEVGFLRHPSGRYSHGQQYVLAVLKEAGLALVSLEKEILRKETGKDVKGMVVNAWRPIKS